jgi:SPOR domain/Tetratricopeptide repeat
MCGLDARGTEVMITVWSLLSQANREPTVRPASLPSSMLRPYLVLGALALSISVLGSVALPHHGLAQTVTPAPTPDAPKSTPAKTPKVKAAAKPAAEGDAPADAKKDPNEAQKHVDNGIRLLQGGKVDAAVHTFSSVIGAGKLPAPIMARALYNRGLAYRKQGKPAQAISDLTSALWLKGGLNDAERADALASRVGAYRDAGLSDQSTGEGATAAADNKVSATRSKTSDQTTSGLTTQSTQSTRASPQPTTALAQEQPQAAASGGLGGLFGNWFGGGTSTAAKPEPAPSAPVAAPTTASVPAPISPPAAAAPTPAKSAKAAPAPVVVASAAVASLPASAAKPSGAPTHRAQVALVRSQADADALVKKLKGPLAAAIGRREPSVDQVTLGGMGTFIRVRLGPFANEAEAQSACDGLKSGGLNDCVAVVQ